MDANELQQSAMIVNTPDERRTVAIDRRLDFSGIHVNLALRGVQAWRVSVSEAANCDAH